MSRQDLLSPGGLRRDNRRPLELRHFECSIHNPSPVDADGAASVTHGLTRVTALVHGPRDGMVPVTNAHGSGSRADSHSSGFVNVTVSTTPFAGQERRKIGRGDRRNVEIAMAIANTFEPVIMLNLYPRSSISISIHLLQTDGGLLQAAINATSLALVASGVSLIDYVAALTVSSLSAPSALLLDPSSSEESDLPSMTVAALPRHSKVTLAQLEDRISTEIFASMVQMGIEGCGVMKRRMEIEVSRWSRSMATTSSHESDTKE